MPKAEAHEKQYKHNKTLLQCDTLQSEENCDWAVTIAFYSAMHLIEKFFANKGIHNKSHEARNNFVTRETVLKRKKIPAKYNFLYNQSIRSRYECVKITLDDLKCVKDALSFIEKELETA